MPLFSIPHFLAVAIPLRLGVLEGKHHIFVDGGQICGIIESHTQPLDLYGCVMYHFQHETRRID
jgi:hypothetical protein